jgi:Holliday junction resolvase
MTKEEYQAWCVRHQPIDAMFEKAIGDVVHEAELHRQIAEEIKRRGWLAFHGSMAHSTFRTPGEPDFVILADGGKVILVECKSRTGKLSVDQQAIAAWAEKLGHKVHVVRSMQEFLEVCQ